MTTTPADLAGSTAVSGTVEGSDRPRCLITNDDGIDSVGLVFLAQVALEAGYEVVVVAPSRDTSGASASITAVRDQDHFLVEPRKVEGLEDCTVLAAEAMPAFIALTASRGAFGPPPDLVLSGINDGANTGQAVLHSGTVGAAFTAVAQGIPAMAVSIQRTDGPRHWETAAAAARAALPHVGNLPPHVVLNVNAPDRPLPDVPGVRMAPLASFGAVQVRVVESDLTQVRISVTEVDRNGEPKSDAALVEAGWVTVTPLRALAQVDLQLGELAFGVPTVPVF